jgi:sulfopyruvate decarboxylase alpha subunit
MADLIEGAAQLSMRPGQEILGNGPPKTAEQSDASPWAPIIFSALIDADIRQASYVPDAGHSRLINMLTAHPGIHTTVLTTEEEGVAIAAGAWCGGQRSVLLMQSSGVGNVINMLSLIGNCRIPFLTIVTMRGEWAEFNPWQVPMGRAAGQAMELMGVQVTRVEQLDDLADAMTSALTMAFDSDQAVAVLLSQRLLGRKTWVAK